MKKSKVDDLGLTIEEELSLLYGDGNWNFHGVPSLELPGVSMRDGPLGLRMSDVSTALDSNVTLPSTCYPSPSLLACSFDPSLMEEVGSSMGRDCRQNKVNVLLAPAINIKRNPLCGRNFEYYSEDPYLTGKLASGFIKGLQKEGVGACLKHFACNSQENGRMVNDSIVDERALHELYLKGFEIAITEGRPWTLMTSYNKINGTYVSDSDYLLKDLLRNEWHYNGVVMSDWGGTAHFVRSHNYGLDVEMPCLIDRSKDLLRAIRAGKLDRHAVKTTAERIIALSKRVKIQSDKPFDYSEDKAAEVALQAALNSLVLLQNDGVLPLKNGLADTAIIGSLAKRLRITGGGSSCVSPLHEASFLDCLKDDEQKNYAPGYSFNPKDDQEALRIEAADLAAKKQTVILFLGLSDHNESEGFDRETLCLPEEQLRLFDSLYSVNQNIIVVLNVGAPVELPFADKCRAILLCYLPGQEGGEAIRRIIEGEASPSGKLAETWPIHLSDVPSFGFYPGTEVQSIYRESIYVGYRYYLSCEKKTRFPFGHGLSYGKFKYGKLTLSDKTIEEGKEVKASIEVTNSSNLASALTVMLFLEPTEGNVFKAKRTLIGFQKQTFGPKETKIYEFSIPYMALSHYDIGTSAFLVEGGKYQIEACSDAETVESKACLKAISPDQFASKMMSMPIYYNVPKGGFLQYDNDFEDLLGHHVSVAKDPRSRPYTLDSTFGDISSTWIGKILMKKARASFPVDENNGFSIMVSRSIAATPIRNIVMNGYSQKFALAVVDFANGHMLKGLFHLLFGVQRRDL